MISEYMKLICTRVYKFVSPVIYLDHFETLMSTTNRVTTAFIIYEASQQNSKVSTLNVVDGG